MIGDELRHQPATISKSATVVRTARIVDEAGRVLDPVWAGWV
jgi:hypothetical protein